MAYVDLKPIRAKMVELTEDSDHSSVKKRIQALQEHQPQSLMQFVGNPREPIPFALKDSLELVGRAFAVKRAVKQLGYICSPGLACAKPCFLDFFIIAKCRIAAAVNYF